MTTANKQLLLTTATTDKQLKPISAAVVPLREGPADIERERERQRGRERQTHRKRDKHRGRDRYRERARDIYSERER